VTDEPDSDRSAARLAAPCRRILNETHTMNLVTDGTPSGGL
jgi:hypothetical protein